VFPCTCPRFALRLLRKLRFVHPRKFLYVRVHSPCARSRRVVRPADLNQTKKPELRQNIFQILPQLRKKFTVTASFYSAAPIINLYQS
jgi:hypothetical protein